MDRAARVPEGVLGHQISVGEAGHLVGYGLATLPHRKNWMDTATWKEGAMTTRLKESVGMVARVKKEEKQLLGLGIRALPAPSPALP